MNGVQYIGNGEFVVTEECTIRFTYGDVKSWKYSELKGED